MEREQILQGIYDVLREHLEVQRPLGPDTEIGRDLELDSLKQITFVVELENRFRIALQGGDEEGIRTLGQLAQLVARRLSDSRHE